MPNDLLTTPDSKETADNKASAKTKQSQRKSSTASLSIVGKPNLKSGMMITLSMRTKRNSGNFLITEVTHKIDSGGYTTELELERRGVPNNTPANKTPSTAVAKKNENSTAVVVNKSVGQTKPIETKPIITYDSEGKPK